MELSSLLLLAVIIWLAMGTIMAILVASNLSRRLDDHYYDLEETEETFRSMVSQVWKYVEAVDESATGGAGNTLFLERMSSRNTQSRQPA